MLKTFRSKSTARYNPDNERMTAQSSFVRICHVLTNIDSYMQGLKIVSFEVSNQFGIQEIEESDSDSSEEVEKVDE